MEKNKKEVIYEESETYFEIENECNEHDHKINLDFEKEMRILKEINSIISFKEDVETYLHNNYEFDLARNLTVSEISNFIYSL